jgi:hypothetical protein
MKTLSKLGALTVRRYWCPIKKYSCKIYHQATFCLSLAADLLYLFFPLSLCDLRPADTVHLDGRHSCLSLVALGDLPSRLKWPTQLSLGHLWLP